MVLGCSDTESTYTMSEFWLISAPGDKANMLAWDRMNTVTAKANLSCNSKFIIPDLKVKGKNGWGKKSGGGRNQHRQGTDGVELFALFS